MLFGGQTAAQGLNVRCLHIGLPAFYLDSISGTDHAATGNQLPAHINPAISTFSCVVPGEECKHGAGTAIIGTGNSVSLDSSNWKYAAVLSHVAG